ncbi:MAG: ZIP family metal transporter [Anaerolineales bacterium]
MKEILIVLSLASLPALGNFIGGLFSEWLKPSKHFVNQALHAASGIILAVVSVEVMPSALEVIPFWALALAFVAGGLFYIIVEALIRRWQRAKIDGAGAGAWMVYVAVSADLIGDGLLIGAGSTVSGLLALLLALGQVLADIPEGFSVLANFRDKGIGRSQRILISVSFVIPVVSAALLAYFSLRGLPEVIQFGVMVFVSGLYCLAAVENMLVEAHESASDTHWSAISFLLGYALFLLVSGGL